MLRSQTRSRSRPWAVWLAAAGLLASMVGAQPASAAATGRTYTLDADFDEGTLVGVNHDAPNSDQLQLNESSSTFPFIWVANSNDGTISKLDTVTGAELARYYTAPQNIGRNPSRTTVDLDGNVWVGNRNSNTVTKVGLREADNCVDRNLNGVIDTSTGPGDIRPWPAGGPPADECVLLHVPFPAGQGNQVRMVAIDAANNVYAGSSSDRWFHHIDGTTGAILRSRQLPSAINYGGVVDPEGNLWVATLASVLHRYNPTTDSFTSIPLSYTSYGLGIDRFGHIWNSGWCNQNISKIDRATATIVATYPLAGGGCVRGVAVEDNGSVWIANSSRHGANHISSTGADLGFVPTGNTPTGAAVDAAGKVWITNLGSNNATRIDPATHATSSFGVGNGPYNYSDMTGIVVRNITTTQGTWTVTHDGGEAGAQWGTVDWNGSTPAGTAISARVRAADTQAGLGAQPWTAASDGVAFAGVTGRYIQVEMKLETTVNGASPVLHDMTVSPVSDPCIPDTLTWRGDLAGGTYNLGENDSMDIIFHWSDCINFVPNESVIIVVQDLSNPWYPVTTWVFGYDITVDMLAEQYVQTFTPSNYHLRAGTDLQILVYMDYALVGAADVHIIP